VVGFRGHGNEPLVSIKKAGYSLKSWITISFSKNILHRGIVQFVDYTSSQLFMSLEVSTENEVANKSIKNVAELKHLRTAVTMQNYIYKDFKNTLNSGDAW